MQKHASRERIFFAFVLAATLVIAGQAAKFAYENHKLTQWLKEEEIYMFRDTYSFHSNISTVYAYYMVCEPNDDKVQLIEELERLIKDKQIIQGMKGYFQKILGDKYGYNDLRISIRFYKPSREFPIGWQPEKGYDLIDYQELSYNLLLSINIPWNAESEDNHTYNLWWKNTRLNCMDFDVYKRQMQEDGSIVLVTQN